MWQENWREKLSEYRQGIDEIDFKVLELVGKRMELSERIGEIKIERGLPACVPEREIQVIATRQNWGIRYRLRAKFVKALFRVIMFESKKIQKELVKV
ncbi:MAG: chorismate mutase [Candidatus Omnitrophota bacterium]|nr:chorismate mutase [Candidatus Omnitrophota bacterium]